MSKHWVTIRAEFDINDEIELRTDQRIMEASLVASDMASLENILVVRVQEVATAAWERAGLHPTGEVRMAYGDEVVKLMGMFGPKG